jgi:hypothetical protein
MRIGEILVEQRWVDPAALALALAEQPGTGQRICSLLIARGQLDPDHAARALASQHDVAGLLQRHLEHRDRALAGLLPAAIARAHVALPIGRTGAGELIVCVRDPGPAPRAAIAAVVAGPILIAVAPAHQLEALVELEYAATGGPEDAGVEIDLSTRPIAILHDVVAAPPGPPGPPAPPAPPAATVPAPVDEAVEVDLSTRQIPLIGDPLDHLGSLTLVELDDARVARDPSQSGQHAALVLPRTSTGIYHPPRTTTVSRPPPRTTTVSRPPPRTTTVSRPPLRAPGHPRPPGGSLPLAPRGPVLDAAIAAIDRAAERPAADEAAMQYLAGRFRCAVWFAIHEGAALGERGHGDQLTPEVIEAIAVPLGAPSILQLAHDTRQLATAPPPGAGAIQDRLARALGHPARLAAMPIEVDARVALVIAAGDPIDDPATAGRDLEQLGRALAGAYRRIAGR